ncbi:MAG: lytic polysaccharide monooxygenase auxiliary activity family 9 protein [Acidobacteriota bacterium]
MMTERLDARLRPRLGLWLSAILLCLVFADGLLAHGSIQTPASRIYKCRFQDNPEDPQDPACAAAIAFVGSPQFVYDWNAIRQGNAAGQHQQVVPDGELCSGGGAEFAGLDLPRDDWRATPVFPDGSGNFEFIYHATAPHSTRDMLFYVTRQGWDPNQPLRWEDLDLIDEPGNPNDPVDPFCHLTLVTLEVLPGIGEGYRMVCPLPERSGRHVIYHVWQRDDSEEAFYACVDVILGASEILFADGFESGDLNAW